MDITRKAKSRFCIVSYPALKKRNGVDRLLWSELIHTFHLMKKTNKNSGGKRPPIKGPPESGRFNRDTIKVIKNTSFVFFCLSFWLSLFSCSQKTMRQSYCSCGKLYAWPHDVFAIRKTKIYRRSWHRACKCLFVSLFVQFCDCWKFYAGNYHLE